MAKKPTFNENPKMMATLEADAKCYLDALKTGKSAHDIAVQMYRNRNGASEKVAEDMVTEIENLIQQYHNDLGMLGIANLEAVQNTTEATVKANQEKLIDRQLDDAVSAMASAQERCCTYYRMLLAIEAYRIYTDGQPDAEERANAYMEKYSQFDLSDAECEKREGELRNDVKEALKSTTFLADEMSGLLQTIKLVDTDEQLVSVVAEYGEACKDQKLILCTLAYLDATNDVYQDLNGTTSMKEIVYAICIGLDTGALASEVVKGKVPFPLFKFILGILGSILGAAIAAIMAFWLAGTIVGWLSLTGLAYLIVFGILWLLGIVLSTEDWSKWVSSAGRKIGTGIDKVVEGALTLARDAYDKLKNERPFVHAKTPLEKYSNKKAHSSSKTVAPMVAEDQPLAASKYQQETQNQEETPLPQKAHT